MNTENTQGCLGMGAQIVSKRGNQDKRGEIFTIRLADSRQSYAAHSQPTCECGPDLFFEIWDFSDTPQELEPA